MNILLLIPLLCIVLLISIVLVYNLWMPTTKKIRLGKKIKNVYYNGQMVDVNVFQPQIHRFLFGWTGFNIYLPKKRLQRDTTWTIYEYEARKAIEDYQIIKFGEIIIIP